MIAAADGGTAEEMLGRLEARSGRPLRAMLEISDRCNEACVHCYQVQGQKGELTTAELERVLDQLRELGVLLVTLSGGEATLRSDFLPLVAYARRIGLLVRIFTNGITMTAELARALREQTVLEVEVSLYSSRADVHDFVTGVKGSFERTVRGVRHLHEVGISVLVKTPVMSLNELDLDAYIAFVDSLGARYQLDTGALMPREHDDRAPEAMNARADVLARVHEQYTPEDQRSAPGASGLRAADDILCGAATTVHVEPNGELRPCTQLEVTLGHALQDGVQNGFDSETARGIRAITWGDLHGCRVCELALHCSRCFAASLTERGDALGPYASACLAARSAFEQAAQSAGLSLRIIANAGRDPQLGPYRRIAPGVFEAFDDIVTPADDELAARLMWARRSNAGIDVQELAVRPGELVQIRRPGRKPRLERVPGDLHDKHDDGATRGSTPESAARVNG
jgi:radical SAM protein with 4Fe4S-binding SPASM domain